MRKSHSPDQIAFDFTTEPAPTESTDLFDGIDTEDLARCALTGYTRERGGFSTPMWHWIANTQHDAEEYYAGLDEETRRAEAIEILTMGKWTPAHVTRRFG